MPPRREAWIGAFALVGVAFLVTRVALLIRFPPFVDEALYARWAWAGLDDPGSRFISLANGKEPLLPWLGTVFMWLGFEPLTAVRLVSVLAGALTLTCTALIARELGGRRAALSAAALYVVIPFVFVHDAIGIYDPLATAAVTAALLLEIRLARGGGVGVTLLLGLAFAAGFLTKQTTYVSFALAPVSLLLLTEGSDRGRRVSKWLAGNGIALGIGLACYSVLRFSEHYDDLARLRRLIYPVHSVGETLASPIFWIEHNWPLYQDALVGYLTVPVLLLLALGAGLSLWRVPRLATLLATWGLVPLIVAVLLADDPFPRFLLTGIPPLVALAGYGTAAALERLSAWAPRRWSLAAGAVAAVLAVAPAVVFDVNVLSHPATVSYPGLDDVQYATGWASGGPWPKLADELRSRAVHERTTVLMGEHGSTALELLLRHEPTLAVVGEADGTTRFGVENSVELPDPAGAVTWRELARYDRPRGGDPLVLLERGVVVENVFITTPDELREQLGVDDAGFDAFLGARQDIGDWYREWYEARS